MLYKEYVKISALSVHKIGNKAAVEGVELSDSPVVLDETLGELLKTYFLMAFKDDERYAFGHPTSMELNEVYAYVGKIFDGEDSFHEQSRQLAKLLYDKSEHPNIKRGDFYVVYFKDCILDGETIDAGSELINDGARNLKVLSEKIDSTKMKRPSFLMVLTGIGDYAYKRPEDGVLVVPIGCLKD